MENSKDPQQNEDGSYYPSPFILKLAIVKKTTYVKQEHEVKYTGTKPILVVCTDEAIMEMANKKKFSTGNHPVEMLVPMLHFRDAGFTFDIATQNGGAAKLEMWAFPTEDENVVKLHQDINAMLENPKKLADITSLDEYSAIFIPGGHGAMLNLPFSKDLGRLLHMAHDQGLLTVTLCHGPAALLAAGAEGLDMKFAYDGYKMMCFTDLSDSKSPGVGYLPGPMPWKAQESLENKGATIVNKSETGDVMQDRELISGDSPAAADPLGKFAAPILVKYAMENRL